MGVKPALKISLRIDFGPGQRLGPGKVKLLEAIASEGSISAAARSISMSYKRAWDLVDELNTIFSAATVESKTGGSKGGGASLTPLGLKILKHYQAIQTSTETVAKPDMDALRKLLK